jgi:cell division protein FtsW (lipid II flippase)
MGFPLPETRAVTVQAIGHADTFGTGMTQHQLQRLEELEQQSEDSMFLIIADLHLDKVIMYVCIAMFCALVLSFTLALSIVVYYYEKV